MNIWNCNYPLIFNFHLESNSHFYTNISQKDYNSYHKNKNIPLRIENIKASNDFYDKISQGTKIIDLKFN